MSTRGKLANAEKDSFVMVDEDENAINDFHQHHKVKKETTFKQKFF